MVGLKTRNLCLFLTVGLMIVAPSIANASLMIAYEDERQSNNSGIPEKLGDDVVAQAGDVLVITAAKSKSLVYDYSVTSSDGGAASGPTHLAWVGDKNLDLLTFDITTGGTFDFDVTPGLAYTTFGTYLLRADYGAGQSIVLLDSDANYEAADISPNTSSLAFAQASGIVIETYSSGSLTYFPAGLDGYLNSSGENRATATGTFTDATALSYDWVVTQAGKNSRTAGAAFKAIPEPASALMLTAGVAVLLFRRKSCCL